MNDLVQSQPFMPPPREPTARNLFVFGDLTIAFEKDLRQLLHTRQNPTLQSFFDHVSFAIREEVCLLPVQEQQWFPRFTDLIDLVANLDGTEGVPAMRFALLCVYQLGRFIHHFTEGPTQYPSADSTHLLGLCTGWFAVAAVSTSQTVAELFPAGVEVVRVALRTGIRSLKFQRDVERPLPDLSRSWSVLAGLSEAEATALVDSFSADECLPVTSKPYVSASSPSNVTISGAPSVLKHLINSKSLKAYPISVESPYHAAHLYCEEDVDDVLGELRNSNLATYRQRIPILSSALGEIIIAEDFKSLLRRAVNGTLRSRIEWNKILPSFAASLAGSGSAQLQKCSIWPVASGAATLLSSKLGTTSQLDITICDRLNVPVDSVQQATPTHRFKDSKIAITGFSGRFPEAVSNDEFWELLRAGRDTHRTIPPDRFDWEAHYDETGKKKNKTGVKYGCFINEPGLFDARFFNLSPREAENTDPAQRLAITTAYEALEMAGFVPDRTPSSQRDRVGVFFGVTSDDWREVNSGQDVDTYFIPGGNRAFVPGRISYFFRFCGPAISVDTACSSSFAAIQTACSFLWQGDCDTAVAGGTNVLTNPDNFVGLDRGHFLSTTGNCNPFDDAASGYCRADAIGSVVLKRLEDALADNDPIFGVIAGSNTNHCGQTVSITRPHEGDQLSLFKRILRDSNTNPMDVSYVEMHGTGTQAGDAAEMQSVLKAFVPGYERKPSYPLHLGAVKANIGHSESASGVSALIKVLKMMEHGEIPPHVGIKTKINHNYPLDLAERNVHIAFEPTPWRRADCPGGKRVCFLNNFSAAGGNTAILLEDAPIDESSKDLIDPRTLHAVAVTAKSPKSLENNVAKLVAYLERHPDTSVPALSYTTTARRAHHKFRVMSVGTEMSSILGDLKLHLERSDIKAIPARPAKVAWAFTGQGSLYAGIGRQYFQCFSQFRSDILHFDRIAQQQGFSGFLNLVVCSPAEVDIDAVDTPTAHLALVCVQMALSRLWMSWGIKPTSVVGHSLGEYAALYAAGVLSPSDVTYLVGTRARLLTTHCTKKTHSMLAVKSSVDVVSQLIGETGCEIACINSPNSTVVSGLRSEIERLADTCRSQGQTCTVLDIPYAFHSAQVDPILTDFKSAARGVTFTAPSVPYLSPLLAQTVSEGGILTASYLSNACREAVNLKGALQSACDSGIIGQDTVWLEIGSHPACCSMVKDTVGPQVIALASMRKDTDAWKTLTEAIRTLYLQGIDIDWNEFNRDFPGSKKVLPLPSYQWDLKNYWIQYRNNFCLTKGDDLSLPYVESQAPAEVHPPLSSSVHRILEERNAIDASTLLVESDIHNPRLEYVIQGHRVNGVPLCPSSLYADMALTIVRYMLKSNNRWNDRSGFDCGTMKVDKPLIAKPDTQSQLLRVSATADWCYNAVSLAFFSVNAQSQRIADHATCVVNVTEQQNWIDDWKRSTYLIQSRIDLLHQAVDGGTSHKLKRGLAYKLFASLVDYSSNYQGMQEVVFDSDTLEATARVVFQIGDAGFDWNPCWIDSCGHIAGFIMNGNDNVHSKDQVFINHGWDAMRCAKPLESGKTYCTYNRMQLVSGTLYTGDTYILEDGVIIAIFEGIKFQGVPRRMIEMVFPRNGKSTQSAPKPAIEKVSRSKAVAPDQLPAKSPMIAAHEPTKSHIQHAQTPKNNVSGLLDVVSQETGIAASELDTGSQLPDLGIDSLLTLTISGRLKEELGLDVSLTECFTLDDIIARAGGTGTISPVSSGAKTPATSEGVGTLDTDPSSINEEDHPTDIIEAIRAVIARETSVSIEDLTPYINLEELGVDSLHALTAMSTLSETLGMSLPPTLLVDSATLTDVENILGMNGYIESPRPMHNTETTGHLMENTDNNRATAHFERSPLGLHRPPHATSVRLQGFSTTASRTLFFFPDGAGSATSYAPLPDISPDVVVYGLNCPWMRTPDELTCSLEQYVAKFLVEVQRRQPSGPYYFGGWSAGGILAYEAAHQLANVGETTERLILLDSPDPVGLQNPPQRMYDFVESLDMFGMEGRSAPKWLRPHMAAFIHMLDNYKVKAFSGSAPRTQIIYARDGLCKHPDDPRPETRPDDPREMLWLLNNRTDFSGGGWCTLIGRDKLQVDVVDNANHYTILTSAPAVQKVCSLIAEACK